MVVKKKKKIVKQRGSRTCGWGLVHRGSGQKGGYGNAGSGKRSDAKKPSYRSRVFGRHGFVNKNAASIDSVLNIKDVSLRLHDWIANKQVIVENGVPVVDLGKLGFTKLLGSGQLRHKVKIIVQKTAAGVDEKVKAAGGEVVRTA